MKPLQQYFHMALFVNYQCALTFVFFAMVNERKWWLLIIGWPFFAKACNDNQNDGKNSYEPVDDILDYIKHLMRWFSVKKYQKVSNVSGLCFSVRKEKPLYVCVFLKKTFHTFWYFFTEYHLVTKHLRIKSNAIKTWLFIDSFICIW